MALSALSRGCKHHVFPSFHGKDVRRGLLGCLLKEFKEKGIDVFIDNDIKRNKSIGPELIKAIRGSMIAVVLISKNYASSTWCLNELVEIMKCRKEQNQKIMVVFNEVEPSDVKKQSGYFGTVFNKTCTGKTKKEVERWKQALDEVAKIAGYNSLKWDNDALMAERIATDISIKLNDSIASNDFEGLVGVENHIEKIESLLSLKSDEVRMVGIWGPAGIGKTTIAKAFYRKLSSEFTHSAFIDNINRKFKQNCHQDEHAFMLYLQEQLLSKTLNQKDLKIGHLDVAKARLKHKKVLIVLDDVDELRHLEAMTKKYWFGSKSRIIITTKDKHLLKAHAIKDVYSVDYPSQSESLEILCQSAFRQNSPPSGFKDMAIEVTCLAGNLPLGLSVFGAYLRGMSEDEWKHALPRLRTSLDGKIEKVLRFSYDALCYKDQELFLHIACFFKGGYTSELVECLESGLNVNHGLKVLCDRSFVSILECGLLLVHNLLEQLAKEIVRRQSISDPGKRQFLVDSQEISDVLSENTGTGSIRGIDFDLSEMRGDIVIGEKAFEGMSRLQFIRFKSSWYLDKKAKLVLPQGLKFRGNKLRYLQWDEFPMTTLPREFYPRFLVNLEMKDSKLEKLWEEPIPLPCLKKMDLYGSSNLKSLPNLSKATNLEVILATFCTSLVEVPSSIGNAINLKTLNFNICGSLVVLPSSIWSLKRLEYLGIIGCSKLNHLGSQLITSSDISANITEFNMSNTEIEEFPSSILAFSHLRKLSTMYGKSLKVFPDVPESIEVLLLHQTGIEEVPPWIQKLSSLTELSMCSSVKLKILPSNINLESLTSLDLRFCTQLKMFPEISTSIVNLNISNTAIEEVPSSIWSWFRLQELNLEDCKSLFHIGLEDLNLSNTETDSLSGVSETSQVRQLRINLNGCINLVSLPHFPDFVTTLDAVGCELLQSVDGFPNNPHTCHNFGNCFNLNQEAKELISKSMLALLPGKELPGYFDHQANGDFLTINLEDQRPFPLLLRFKACLLLLHGEFSEEEDDTKDKVDQSTDDKKLSCCVWGVDNGVDVGSGSCKYTVPGLLGLEEHLYFLESSISMETGVSLSELVFEFKITGKYWRIEECGVTLLDDDYGSIYNEAKYKESADIIITECI